MSDRKTEDRDAEAEETLAEHRSEGDEREFSEMVGLLESIMVSEEFQALQDGFCRQHCDVFDDSEELKLEYSSIHEDYMVLVEGFLARECEARSPGFTMDELLKVLSDADPEDITGDVFELLLSLADIQEFKSVMLGYKASAGGLCLPVGGSPGGAGALSLGVEGLSIGGDGA